MFIARANPTVAANKLSKPKTERLFDAIRLVLSDAVELGSALPITPDDIGGSIYGNGSEWEWRVYDRELMPCIECERPLKRIVQGGRSTYFCRQCQKR
jgi:formamidopyrimidine-DNA glycosylase